MIKYDLAKLMKENLDKITQGEKEKLAKIMSTQRELYTGGFK